MTAVNEAQTWLRLWSPVILLGVATIGAYGAVHYSFGVLLEPIRKDTGWSAGQLAGGFSLSLLLGGLLGVLAGRVLDRKGSRWVFIVSLVVGCVMLVVASWAREAWQFIGAWTLGSGAVGGGLYYHVTMSVTARLYTDRRPAAFSVLTLLGALAGPVFYPLAGWLVDTLDWRDAVRLLALALALTAFPAAALVHTPPAAPAPRHRVAPRSARRSLRQPRVVLLLAAIACAAAASSALTLHQVSLMQAATGMSLATTSTIAGVRGLFQFAGRLCLVRLIRQLGVHKALAVSYALSAVGVAALIATGPMVLLGLFIAATGLALGLLAPLHGLIATETYDQSQLGTLMRVQHVNASIAAAFGPWLAALALDATGSHVSVVVLIIGLQLGALAFLAGQRRTAPARTSAKTTLWD